MTTHRLPWNFINQDLGTHVTAVSIDVSGTAAFGGDMSITGRVSAGTADFGGQIFAASAITFVGDTTVQATARSSADALLKITMNGTGYVIPVYSSAAY